MSSADAPYKLLIVTRCKVAHLRLVPGQVLQVERGSLGSAAWLCRVGSARPLDRHTALDVALHQALAQRLA